MPRRQNPAFIAEKAAFAEIMLNHGIEWEQKGTHEKHLSVLDFEKKQRAEEVEQLNAEIESAKKDLRTVEKQLNQTVPKLKNAEKLAADFPEDVDKILPEVTLRIRKWYSYLLLEITVTVTPSIIPSNDLPKAQNLRA